MIPLDQQRKLVSLAGAVSSPYDLVYYDEYGRPVLIRVIPEPAVPYVLVELTQTQMSLGTIPAWARLYHSLVTTGRN